MGRIRERELPLALRGRSREVVALVDLLRARALYDPVAEGLLSAVQKAEGAGYQVTAYTQTWSDVEARIGSRAKAGQVAGNFNTLVMLRVRELATAEMLTRQLKEVPLYSMSQNSGVSDSSEPLSPVDFVARNEDRLTLTEAPLLTPGDLMELSKGQAFALLEDGQLWKIRIPLPEARDDPCMPESLAAIACELGRAAERAEPPFPAEHSDGAG